jgi:hypothetical protein
MTVQALLLALSIVGQSSVGNGDDAAMVALLQQNIGAVETAARAAKQQKAGDADALAAIEKKYTETVAVLDGWRAAALGADKDWSNARQQLAGPSTAVAQAFAEFGRDARAPSQGRQSAINSAVVARTADRFLAAGRVLTRSDEDTRNRLAGTLVLRAWSEL